MKHYEKLKTFHTVEPRLYLLFDYGTENDAVATIKVGISGVHNSTPNSPYWRAFYMGRETACRYKILQLWKGKRDGYQKNDVKEAETYFKRVLKNWSNVNKRYPSAKKVNNSIEGSSEVFQIPKYMLEDLQYFFKKECKKLKLKQEDVILSTQLEANIFFDNINK